MKKLTSTTRQRYLSLVSRLYDLAAEFTDDELREMVSSLTRGESSAVGDAIEALIKLHEISVQLGAAQSGTLTKSRSGRSDIGLSESPAEAHPETRRKSRSFGSFENLLLDQSIFASVSEVARLFPKHMQPQAKESRARYVKRATRYLASLSDRDREIFENMLADKLSNSGASNFISSWKTLIRDL